jgi:hypothetical protein
LTQAQLEPGCKTGAPPGHTALKTAHAPLRQNCTWLKHEIQRKPLAGLLFLVVRARAASLKGLRRHLLSRLIKRVTTSSRKANENPSDSQPAPDASLTQDPESTWLADSRHQFLKWTRKVGSTKLRLPALFFWILKAHLLALVLTLAHISKSLPALRSPGLQPRAHRTCLATMGKKLLHPQILQAHSSESRKSGP